MRDMGEAHALQTVHVCFAASCITVTSTAAPIIRQLAANFEPMLAVAPKGRVAGFFEVTEERGGWVIDGSDSSCEHFRSVESTVRALYHMVLKVFINSRRDLLWLHAGAASLAGRAIVFCAPSGQGKSTIVAELLDRGWAYCSDEIVPIDPLAATVLPFPLCPYKRVSPVRGYVREGHRMLNKIRVKLEQVDISPVPVPLARIFFLRYSVQDLRTSLVDRTSGEALVELLTNSLTPSESRGREIQQLSSVLCRVPSTYVHYSDAVDFANHIASLRAATVG